MEASWKHTNKGRMQLFTPKLKKTSQIQQNKKTIGKARISIISPFYHWFPSQNMENITIFPPPPPPPCKKRMEVHVQGEWNYKSPGHKKHKNSIKKFKYVQLKETNSLPCPLSGISPSSSWWIYFNFRFLLLCNKHVSNFLLILKYLCLSKVSGSFLDSIKNTV